MVYPSVSSLSSTLELNRLPSFTLDSYRSTLNKSVSTNTNSVIKSSDQVYKRGGNEEVIPRCSFVVQGGFYKILFVCLLFKNPHLNLNSYQCYTPSI